jgi:hypothetical protein
VIRSRRIGAPCTCRPDLAHPFGTDDLGILSRVIFGAGASLAAGFISVVIGVPLRLLAGYFGSVTDVAISRCADAVLACPFLMLGIALAAFLGAEPRLQPPRRRAERHFEPARVKDGHPPRMRRDSAPRFSLASRHGSVERATPNVPRIHAAPDAESLTARALLLIRVIQPDSRKRLSSAAARGSRIPVRSYRVCQLTYRRKHGRPITGRLRNRRR